MGMHDKKVGRNQYNHWHHLWKATNVFLIVDVFSICWFLFYSVNLEIAPSSRGNWLIIALYLFLYITFAGIYSAFDVSPESVGITIYSQALSIFVSDFIIYFVMALFGKKFPPVWLLLAAFVGQLLISALWTGAAHSLYFIHKKPERSVIIWDERTGLEYQIAANKLDSRFDVTASVHVLDCIASLEQTMNGIEVVFLYGIHSHDRNQIIKYCVEQDIHVYVVPTIGDLIMESAQPVQILHLPMMLVNRYAPGLEYLLIKRAFDVFASSLAIILFSPLMIVVALLIKRDGGPAFYKQKRLTRNGKVFEVIKFRSMRVDAEKDGVARLSTGDNDDRITPIGRFIRKVRIDELPQLFNVVRGDMSLVGPRPERPEIAAEYARTLPEFALRLQAKAGITGYAQVYGKYNTSPYDKLLMDLHYIASASVLEDLRIMFATVKILFIPESTEGVAKGQTTALGEKEAYAAVKNKE